MQFVDQLAQEIRRVDGNHSLGAGALAEKLMPLIEAALAAAPAVAVKPLEWKGVQSSIGIDDHVQAITDFGVYRVYPEVADKFSIRPYLMTPFHSGVQNFKSEDEAKAAAQADYERRIRSALVPVAAEPRMWFVKDFADGWIAFDNEADAKREVDATGAMMMLGYQFPVASPVAQATDVPEGWALVPKDPTLTMQKAGWREIDKQGFQTEDTEVAPIYRAMITAAPTPKADGGQ
jgi:hypothetical protein